MSSICTIIKDGNTESFQTSKDKFGLVNQDLYLKEIKDNAQIYSNRTNYYTGIQESYKKDSIQIL